MAIAFDAGTDGNVVTGTNLSFNHTVTGSLPILFVGFSGDSVGGNDDITSVTYNGVSMTLAAKKTNATNGDRMMYVYYLLGPATGTHSVSVSCTNSHNLSGGAVSYTGVKQSAQPDATTTNFETVPANQTLTTSITTINDNSWVMLLEGCFDGSSGPTAGAGATRRVNDTLSTFGAWGLFDSNGAVHPAGSYSMTTNRSANPFGLAITHVVVSFQPDTGAAATPHYCALLGVGG